MQTGHGVSSVFGYKYRLIIFFMPSIGFSKYIVSDHVYSAGIAIPGVVTIETDHIEKLTSLVFLKFTISIDNLQFIKNVIKFERKTFKEIR